MVARIDNLLKENWYKIPGMELNGPEGLETPVRTTTSTEFETSLLGQRMLINALATYKQWKVDNNLLGNKYYNIPEYRDRFAKENPGAAFILDQLPKEGE